MKKLIFLISVITLISCNNKKETKFVETELSDNYKIKLPIGFEKTDEGMWKFSEHTYLDISVISGTVKSLKEEVDTEAKVHDIQENYKGKVFVKTESFEENGFKGVVSFYEKDNQGKGLGLVSLKSYIVFGVVQDDKNRIYINSLSLSRNINDDLLKSIKSISSNKMEITENKFDEEKAKSNGYQIFKDDNFIIKCKGKILFDKLRFESYQQAGQENYSKPYHVFNNGVDYNINVSDMSSLLNGKNNNEITQYNNEDLTYYQTKLDEMAIKNVQKKFKNFNAIFYQILLDGKLTKAVYFHNHMKSYVLQVSSKKNNQKLFDEFINSFELIEK